MDGNYGNNDDEEKTETGVDENLLPLDRLKTYVHSPVLLRRLFVVRDLADTLSITGYENCIGELLPAIKILSDDTDPVIRENLMQQIPLLWRDFLDQGKEDGYKNTIDYLFGYIENSLTDSIESVRTAGHAALLIVIKYIEPEDLKKCMCPIFESLLTEDVVEDVRLEMLSLICPVATLLKKDLCIQSIVPILIKLSDDRPLRVRRMCAPCFGTVFSVIQDIDEDSTLLKAFLLLCNDDIWGVRKGCLESFIDVSKNVKKNVLKDILAPKYIELLNDRSSWVRQDSQKNLGYFVHLYATEISNDFEDEMFKNLFDIFVDIPLSPDGNMLENQFEFFRAFSLPAVVLGLGGERWELMSIIFERLANSLQWKVRQTIAHSLHEIAAIVGPETTEKELIPIFDVFLGDIDEVKVGLLKGFSKFFVSIKEETRESFILRFPMTIRAENTNNWRYRLLIASEIINLTSIMDVEMIEKHLCKLAISLAFDDVFLVRDIAHKSIGGILKRFNEDAPGMEELFLKEVLDNFNNLETAQQKQNYITLCENLSLYCEKEHFTTQFLSTALGLVDDKICNVRMTLARTLYQISLQDNFIENEELKAVLEKLKQDPIKDVADLASGPALSIIK